MNDHCVEGQGLDVSELLKGFQGKGRRERGADFGRASSFFASQPQPT